MPCDELDAGLAADGRMRGGMTRDGRPAGGMTADGRMRSSTFCRSFDFTPAPTGFILTFANDDMTTFAGDLLATF